MTDQREGEGRERLLGRRADVDAITSLKITGRWSCSDVAERIGAIRMAIKHERDATDALLAQSEELADE